MNFFRKYQRPILLTAVLFALVTFSITGDMLSFFGNLYQDDVATSTVEVNGKRIDITSEDMRVGRAVARQSQMDFVQVVPAIGAIDPNERMADKFAVLRRLAIESGIDASYAEVDRALQAAAANHDREPRDLLLPGFSSFDAYRNTIYEAMRIATYLRVQALALRPFDHSAAARLLDNHERVTLKVALLDREAIEKEVETELDGSGDAAAKLKTWLDEMSADDRRRNQFNSDDLFQIEFAAVEASKFDPAQFATELEGFEVADDAVTNYYNRHRASRYQIETPKESEDGNGGDGKDKKDDGKDETPKDDKKDGGEDQKPKDGDPNDAGENQDDPKKDEPKAPQFRELDDALREEIRTSLKAEKVLAKIWGDVQAAMYAEIEPLIEPRTAAFKAMNEADSARQEAQAKVDEKPDDEALEAALEAAEQAYEDAKSAHEAADKAVSDKRVAFDAMGKFRELTAGKSGFVVIAPHSAPVKAKDLEEVEGMGKWPMSWSARTMRYAGQMANQVQWNEKFAFEYRCAAVELSPVKPYDDIADEVRAAYLTKRADEIGEERKEKFTDELDRLGREKRATQIAEIEAKTATEVAEKLEEWRKDLTADIEESQGQLEATRSSRARARLEAKLAKLREEVADEDGKRKSIESAMELETEGEIDDEIAKAYAEILDACAAAAKFEIQVVGPRLRSPSSRGPIQRHPKLDQFLFYQGRVRDLDEGESTGVIDDRAQRRTYFALCTKVEPATLADMSRRDVLESITQRRMMHVMESMQLSFSREALVARDKYTEPGETAGADESEPGN